MYISKYRQYIQEPLVNLGAFRNINPIYIKNTKDISIRKDLLKNDSNNGRNKKMATNV